MSYTKKELIDGAFEEIGLADYDFDLKPEEYQSALRKLDSMMASWNSIGVRLRYPLPSKPSESKLNDLSNVPDSANEAIITNLAIRIAPLFSKNVSNATTSIAKTSYENLTRLATVPQEIELNTTILGAGNKSYENNIFINSNTNTF